MNAYRVHIAAGAAFDIMAPSHEDAKKWVEAKFEQPVVRIDRFVPEKRTWIENYKTYELPVPVDTYEGDHSLDGVMAELVAFTKEEAEFQDWLTRCEIGAIYA